MIIQIELPRKFDNKLGAFIPDSILDGIQDDPLQVYHLGEAHQPFLPILIEQYASTLHLVFLIFVPFSVLSVLVVALLPEYSLDRDEHGEPVRKSGSLYGAPLAVKLWRRNRGSRPRDA